MLVSEIIDLCFQKESETVEVKEEESSQQVLILYYNNSLIKH
jgi:hypothetical protein